MYRLIYYSYKTDMNNLFESFKEQRNDFLNNLANMAEKEMLKCDVTEVNPFGEKSTRSCSEFDKGYVIEMIKDMGKINKMFDKSMDKKLQLKNVYADMFESYILTDSFVRHRIKGTGCLLYKYTDNPYIVLNTDNIVQKLKTSENNVTLTCTDQENGFNYELNAEFDISN